MKTSEFIKYFNTKGYIAFNHYGNIVFEEPRGYEVLEIDSENNVYTAFYDLPLSKQQEYYKVIFEYLMTPPEEREEEKKYYLKLKGFKEPYNTLNFGERTQNYFISEDDNISGFKNQFTQSEIDELPECYKHPAVWEQVPVKERDNV